MVLFYRLRLVLLLLLLQQTGRLAIAWIGGRTSSISHISKASTMTATLATFKVEWYKPAEMPRAG
jgi:hypothetical protein